MDYAGNSMAPILKTGDVLKIVAHQDREIRVGDLAAFRSPRCGTLIVHRVVSADHQGVRTKGDNNLAIDDWVLQPNEIVGRVVSLERNKKRIRILGGFRGQMHAFALGAAKRIDLAFSSTFGPAYRWLGKTGIFRNLFSRWMSIRVSCFNRRGGMELQLRLGQRVIGRRLPGQDRWHIRRPFRLFVDESALPKGEDVEGKQVWHRVKGEKG